MIPMQDWMLVGGLVAVCVTITFALSSIYYAQRVYELQAQHVEDLQKMNAEIIQARANVREVRMKSQVLDAIPVSRLIDTEEES